MQFVCHVFYSDKRVGSFVCTENLKSLLAITVPSTSFQLTDALKFSFIRPKSSTMNCLLLIDDTNIVTNRVIIKCKAEV